MSYNYKQDNNTGKGTENLQNKSFITPARVIKPILEGETYPEVFDSLGEYQCIGGVFFNSLNNPNPDPNFITNKFALPLFPNMSNIPLENEIVYIITLPSTNIQSNVNSTSEYYFQPINIWNSVHHNAIPDPLRILEDEDGQTGDYEQIQSGLVRQVTDGSTGINLGEGTK